MHKRPRIKVADRIPHLHQFKDEICSLPTHFEIENCLKLAVLVL